MIQSKHIKPFVLVFPHAICVLLVCLTSAAAQFEVRASFPFGSNIPYAVALGDFNRDGKLDLAVTSYLPSGSVTILLGNGDGTFRTGTVYPVAVQPFFLTEASLKHNGILDLVVGDSLSNDVYVLLGNGDGTFQAPVSYPTSGNPIVVSTGDFNGDGRLDIIATTGPPAECECIEVLPGNGDGTFGSAVITPIPYAQDGGGIAAGYFNKDKKLDIGVMGSFSSTDQVDVLLGNGDGSFTPETFYALPPIPPSDLTVGDFNGDQKPDIAVSSAGGNGFAVLLGNGDGTFQYPVLYYASLPDWIVAHDMDSDGILDLVTAAAGLVPPNPVPAGATVFKGNGDGTFQSGAFYGSGTYAVTYLAVGDLNNDGKPDIVLVDDVSNTIVTLLNTGVVSFSPTTPITFPNQLIGTTSAPLSTTLANNGKSPLTISSFTYSGKPFQVQSNCRGTIAPGGNCTISATFTPQVIDGSVGTVTLRDSASSKPQFVELTGTGTYMKFSPPSLNFLPQKVGTKSPMRNIKVTNTSTAAVDFTHFIYTGGDQPYDFQERNDCPTTLPTGGTCTIQVSFTPKIAPGPCSGTVVVTDTGGGSPQMIPLTGTAE